MDIIITNGSIALKAPADTSGLAVQIPTGTQAEAVDKILRTCQIGRLGEAGDHAWVELSRLRERAIAGGCTPQAFDQMVTFAQSEGWIADGQVRAHLEHVAATERTEFQNASPEERSKWWRSVLGEYPTGVAIVSALDGDGKAQGLVVGTFSSVSMEPPLVSFMPMRSSRSYGAIADCTRFRVSVLGAGHEQLCRSFASAPPESRFEVGNWTVDAHGVPRLTDAVIWFDCVRSQTLPVGDHDFVLGQVEDLGFGEGAPGMPMLFLKGGYGTFTMPRLEFEADHLGVHLRVADQMQADVQSLAEEIDAVVTLCSLTKETVVVLTAANLRADGDVPPAVGSTFPFAAPMGLVFAAWSDDAVRSGAWRKAGHALGFQDDEILSRMLKRVRDRGYAVSIGPTMAEQFERITANPAKEAAELQELWTKIAADYARLGESQDWTRHVSSIQVPIFGPEGEPNLALVVGGLSAGLTPDELDRIASRCQAVADELRSAIRGVAPTS